MVCVFGEIGPDALTHRKERATHVHCEPHPGISPRCGVPFSIHFMSLKRRSYEVTVFLFEILNIEHNCNIFRFIPITLYLGH